MNEQDFRLVLRAQRQIAREAGLRSFLIAGVLFCAGLRLLGIDLQFLYLLLFIVVFISLILTSDMFASIGLVSKKDLVKVIENHIHTDPEVLARYSSLRNKH